MLKKGTNMQSCKDGNWLGGKIWNFALDASWMDLMVAPYLIKLPTTKTFLVAKTTKPQTLEIGHHLTTGCSLFYCMFNSFEYEEGRRKTWIGGTMQQANMCALGAFSSPKIDVKLKKGGEGDWGKNILNWTFEISHNLNSSTFIPQKTIFCPCETG
jgi:hypothetical protein